MKPEATLTQSQIERQRSAFIANGGSIVMVRVKESGEIIEELKAKNQGRTVEEWTKLDSKLMRKKK